MLTRSKTKAIVDALVKLRGLATDDQAMEVSVLYPAWVEGTSYEFGERVLYNEVLYRVLTSHTSQADWTPDVAVSLFAKVLIVNENVISAWEQPNSTNPYMTGDKVSHNGKSWTSIVDNNVWEPGVYGWEEIAE